MLQTLHLWHLLAIYQFQLVISIWDKYLAYKWYFDIFRAFNLSFSDVAGGAILVDWLVEVHMKYRLRPETLFLGFGVDWALTAATASTKFVQGVISISFKNGPWLWP